MKYTILQADNSRAFNVVKIHDELSDWDFVPTKCVDGRDKTDLTLAGLTYSISYPPSMLTGQLGVWYSVLNAIAQAPLVVLEDDAVPEPDFVPWLEQFVHYELPRDADFLALYTPNERENLFSEKHNIGAWNLVRCWQPNGGVGVYWTKRGRENFRRLVRRDGILTQWDNQLMNYSWRGELKGYGLRPHQGLVKHLGIESIVQNTKRVDEV